jgi:hypothetical protein
LVSTEQGQHLDLLEGFEIREWTLIASAAALIGASQALSMRALHVLERAAQLAVDVVHDPSPDSAGVLIRRDDLVDHAGERSGFVHGEKLPRRAIAPAGDACSGGSRGSEGSLQEGAAVES